MFMFLGLLNSPVARFNRRNTLVSTIPKLSTSYTVRFEFNPTSFQSGWTNIIHLTSTGGNCCKYGDRVPGVWFWSSSTNAQKNRFHICSAVNGNGNFCYNSAVSVPRGQWTTVEITQRPEGAYYRYEVRVGNVLIGSVINKQAKVFTNVKAYASDNWYNAAQGMIRNLVIDANAGGECLLLFIPKFSIKYSLLAGVYWLTHLLRTSIFNHFEASSLRQ